MFQIANIASKYRCDSPKAFTRAFRNLHGFTPRDARNSEAQLSAYDRGFFRVKIKGGNEMNYNFFKKTAFEVTGRKA